ncbi:MAG: hypothetical protein KDA84_10260 [Planctomycetaceae bacterium]|nr:hypothetical protein [Planctomycetaceae bacterium]
MPRTDLLALTEDDLITLTNRGTVNRALRELKAGTPSFTIEEATDQTLLVNWSGGIVCRFPPEGSLEDAVCSSGATGISRHIVRSVLAYSSTVGDDEATEPPTIEPWDPGGFTDDELQAHFGKVAVTNARTRFDRGCLAEVVRSRKPLVQFLHEPCTVRFLVPGNLNFVYADCADRLLSRYIPQAVWACRELSLDQTSGLVSIQTTRFSIPTDVLDDVEMALAELVEQGIEGSTDVWRGRVVRLEKRCRAAGLIWPAEILLDVLHQVERYQEHDARFDAWEVARYIAEASIRCDAIRSDTGVVPQLLIRGTQSDSPTEIKTARFVGLGCGVHVRRASTRLTAFHQDVDSGNVAAIHREFTNPPEEEPREFSALARTSIQRGISFSRLAVGQLLLKSAKRTPSHELKLPRGALSLNPQTFEWEKLRPPVLAEGFEEIAARLSSLPPAELRPRRATENLHVCPVQLVDSIDFDTSRQQLVAHLQDPYGARAILSHPYQTRGCQGFEALSEALQNNRDTVRFLSGHFQLISGRLSVQPLCLVLESKGKRKPIQPWIEEWNGDLTQFDSSLRGENNRSPIQEVLDELSNLIAEAVTVGVHRLGQIAATQWRELSQECSKTGFIKIAARIEMIANALEIRAESSRWNPRFAVEKILQLNALRSLAMNECQRPIP